MASLPDPRVYMVAAKDEQGRIFLVGGYGDTSHQVDVYDPEEDSWSLHSDVMEGRRDAGVIVNDNNLLVFGGRNESNSIIGSVESFQLSPKGSLDSTVFDAGDIVDWKTVSWTAVQPTTTTISLSTRSATDGINWSAWSSGSTTSGAEIASPPGRYLQYRAELTSNDFYLTPVVSDVVVGFEQQKPKPPVLLYPSDGSLLSASMPAFVWQNSLRSSGDVMTYALQLDRAPSFDSPALQEFVDIFEGPQQSVLALSAAESLADGQWYWRAAAVGENGQSDFSASNSFVIDTRPDYVLTEVSATPESIVEPQTALLRAEIVNHGGASAGFKASFYDGDPGLGGVLIAERTVSSLGAEATTSVETGFETLGNAGTHQIHVVLDPDNDISEKSETNNIGSTTLTVEPHGLSLAINADDPTAAADATLSIPFSISSTAVSTRSAELAVVIVDESGEAVERLSRLSLAAITSTTETTGILEWNASGIYAGNYQVRAQILMGGIEVTGDQIDFTIAPDLSLELGLTATKTEYAPAEAAILISKVRSESKNYIFNDLNISTEVEDASGTPVLTDERSIDQLLPDELKTIATQTEASLAPGEYFVQTSLSDSLGGTLATANTSFTVASSAVTGAGLFGTLSADATSTARFGSMDFTAELVNEGNAGIGADLKLRIVDPTSQTVYEEFDATVTLGIDETESVDFSYPFVDLPAGKSYLAILSAQVGGTTRTLSYVPFTVTKPFETAITETSTTPRVLVWADTTEQGELIQEALDETDIFYRLIQSDDDQSDFEEFKSALRSNFFTHYWIIGGSHPLEGHFGEELTEKVNSGANLLVAGNDVLPKMMDELSPNKPNVLGLKPQGSLSQDSYSIDLFESDISETTELATDDRLAKLKLSTANSLAQVTLTKGKKEYIYETAALNNYGLGQAITLGFDPASVAERDVILDILRRSAAGKSGIIGSALPYSIVPLSVEAASLGTTLTVRVSVDGPNGVEVLPLTGGGLSDGILLTPGTTESIAFLLRLPKEAGVTSAIVSIEYLHPQENVFKPYETKTIELEVDRGVEDLRDEALALLNAIDVKKSDAQKINNIKELVIQAVDSTTTDDTSDTSPIHLTLKAISTLKKIDASVSESRLALGRLLNIFSIDWTRQQEGS